MPTLSRADAPPPATGTRVIVVWSGGLAMRDVAPGTSLTLGRATDCDVQVTDPSLSRKHFTVHLGPPLTVEDLGSANGTRVAGRRIEPHQRTPVEPGLSIEAGDTLVVVQSASAPAAPSRASSTEELERTIALVAKSELSVILVGETGVGKEVMAERIHRASRRSSGKLLALNCAALTETLLESELFGHERGAFTGAVATKPGLLESARGGTVFLDELGEMPMATQARLLRAIEAREVIRVGGVEPRALDVRYLAATNRDLQERIDSGAFRRDLYYRLNGMTLRIPPLRERVAEIAPLARELVQRACAAAGRPVCAIAPAAMARLESHPWPGNVRELRNTVERALVLADGGAIEARHVLLEGAPVAAAAPAPASLRDGVTEFERQRIADALEKTGGNQTRAAELLGISRRTLVSRLSEFGMTRSAKKR